MGHGCEEVFAVGMIIALYAVLGLMILLGTAFVIFLWWKILSKAGFSGALSFLMFVPFGQLIIMMIMAFSKWPLLKGGVDSD